MLGKKINIMRNTQNYKILPFNPELKNYAKILRKSNILHEVLLWQYLKNKKFNNLDFDRQKIIGNYIVDFYCSAKYVVIEVDGSSHDYKILKDHQRDLYFQQLDLTVIRLSAKDVLQNIQDVICFLEKHPAFN